MNEKKITAKIQEDEKIEGILKLEPLRGPNGYSAYELYVQNLSDGEIPLTELEWLESIGKVNYYRQYKQTFITTDENTTIIPININAYNETCLLEVFLNGLRLDNTEYSVNNTTKQIVLTNAIDKGQTIHIIASKTIVATANDYNLLKGEKGENGLDGRDGADGLGVPEGGTTGQILAKKTNADNDTEWIDPPAGTGGGSVTGDTYPIGSITAFAGSTIPANWLLCNGQAISRTDYSELFAVVGTTYGAGDGSTTFNLPDLRGRVAVGVDSTDANLDSLGKTYGEKEVALSINQIPAHTHTVTGRKGSDAWADGFIWFHAADGGNNKTSTHITSSAGGGQAHNNMQPSMAQNFIIKAKQSAGLVATVVDALNSTSSTDALSARQGNILYNKIKGTVVYENESSPVNTGTITLTKSINDAIKVEITYKDNQNYCGVVVYEPNNKKICLQLIHKGASTGQYFFNSKVGYITLNGTTGTYTKGIEIGVSSSKNIVINEADAVYVTKIVAYYL